MCSICNSSNWQYMGKNGPSGRIKSRLVVKPSYSNLLHTWSGFLYRIICKYDPFFENVKMWPSQRMWRMARTEMPLKLLIYFVVLRTCTYFIYITRIQLAFYLYTIKLHQLPTPIEYRIKICSNAVRNNQAIN